MINRLFNQKDILALQKILKTHHKKITCAESCTGGRVSAIITSQSGASDIFDGSIITYSNEIKKQELNVDDNTLNNFTAVSSQVVSQMLRGSLKKFNADYCVAISGMAGPKGGTKEIPVGTVIIGVMNKKMLSQIDIYHFNGSREEIITSAANTSMHKIYQFIKKTIDK